MTAYLYDKVGARWAAFDLTEAQNHEYTVEVTSHPVEKGVNITDHIRPQPFRLSLIGYVTNTPIQIQSDVFGGPRGEKTSYKLPGVAYTPPPTSINNAIDAASNALLGDPVYEVNDVLTFDTEFDRINEMWQLLLEFCRNGVFLAVLTKHAAYEPMVIESLSMPRTAGDAGVAFGVNLRQIRIVSTSKTDANPIPAKEVPGGQNAQAKGGQATTNPNATPGGAAKADKVPASLAVQGLDAVRNLLGI